MESQLRNSSLFSAALELAPSLGSVVAGMLMTIWLPPDGLEEPSALLRVPPTTEARLWSRLTDLTAVGVSLEDLDVCN